MGRCSNPFCTTPAMYRVKSETPARYCQQHAEELVLWMPGKRCLNSTCTRAPSRNFEGCTIALYCTQHAEDGMVNIARYSHCPDVSCTKGPSFNVEGSNALVYCKEHAKDGMVNVRHKLYSYAHCTRISLSNVKANAAVPHDKGDLADVGSRVCSHVTCSHEASFV